MAGPPSIQPVSPELLSAVLEFLRAHASDPAAAQQDLLDLLHDGSLRRDDLLVACEGRDVSGVILAQRLGGAQAAIGLPCTNSPAIAARLVASMCDHLHVAGCVLLQCAVPLPPPAAVAALAEVGFHYTTDLIELARTIQDESFQGAASHSPASLFDTPDSFALQGPGSQFSAPRMTFEPAARDDLAFAELMNDTFIESQDIPELTSRRTTSELLAGCQQAARLEKPLWWYACLHGRRVGVLQLAPTEEAGEFNLNYMGLVPEVRGLGLGVELAWRALVMTATLGGRRLKLACDIRNRPAARIYHQLGFHELGRCGIWLKFFR